MAYKYVSKKFVGSLANLIKEFGKLQENGDVLQAGEGFDRPILPPMQSVVPPITYPVPTAQSFPVKKEAGIRSSNTKSKHTGSNKKRRKQKQ
jgi:hypothetical protein